MPKLPSKPEKPPKKVREKKTTERDVAMMQSIFNRKIVATRYSPRYAHILAGDKTLCGLKASNCTELPKGWDEYTKCLRCEHVMKKFANQIEEAGKEETEDEGDLENGESTAVV